MGRNAKRKTAKPFSPTAADVDLLVEVFEIPGDLLTFPAMKARAESSVGHDWLTRERQLDLAQKSYQAAYGEDSPGDFAYAVAAVISDAMADGLVVAITEDNKNLQVVWGAAAARTRGGNR
jgi:hypothetical protein